jgi:ribonucleotide reductase alpha subunit
LEEHFRLHPEDMTNPVFKEMMKHLQRDPTYDGRMRNRAVGVGGMGLASMLALLGLEYGSKGAMDVATITRACIYWHALDESANLAEEEGVYPTFEGSPLSKGILAPDMWLDEAAYMDTYLEGIDIGNMKRHKHALVDPASFGV